MKMLHVMQDPSLKRRCELLNICRASTYYHPVGLNQDDIDLMNEIHELWRKWPFYGYRRITAALNHTMVEEINRKRVLRLM
jgi:putative transposase